MLKGFSSVNASGKICSMQFVKSTLIATKQNKYRPHIIRRHGLALALVLIVAVQLIYGVQLRASGSVLGYATNITQSELLGYTNNNRTANSLPLLSMNSQLTVAAQNKANHMIANDYWSHIAPDGTTPWYFFDQSGYAYLVAGENLAYGFDTSLGAVNGWMASPTHRDNILLPEYEEVGFGIANGEDYQGTENTVVVAMYGDPVSSTNPAPLVQSQTETTPPVAASIPESLPIKLSANEAVPAETKTPAKTDTSPPVATDGDSVHPLTYLAPAEKSVTNLDSMLNGSASWAMYSTVFILSILAFAYLYRHIAYVNFVVTEGEHMITAHPLLESSLIFIALWLLLSASYGTIL